MRNRALRRIVCVLHPSWEQSLGTGIVINGQTPSPPSSSYVSFLIPNVGAATGVHCNLGSSGILYEAELIDYSRGRVRIPNRKGLETAACECYQTIRNEFDRLGISSA
jgi:hypothetical protein